MTLGGAYAPKGRYAGGGDSASDGSIGRSIQAGAGTFGEAGRDQPAGDLRDCASRAIVWFVTVDLSAPAAGMHNRESEFERTAVVGRALADPKRLCVLESLSAGELSVSEL